MYIVIYFQWLMIIIITVIILAIMIMTIKIILIIVVVIITMNSSFQPGDFLLDPPLKWKNNDLKKQWETSKIHVEWKGYFQYVKFS